MTNEQRIEAFKQDLKQLLEKHGAEMAVVDYDGAADSEICVSFGAIIEGDKEIEPEVEWCFEAMDAHCF